MIRNFIATIILILITSSVSMAQTEMADKMRADGKIYVVVLVLATIFVGIFIYLVLLDKKIKKLEKDNHIN